MIWLCVVFILTLIALKITARFIGEMLIVSIIEQGKARP